MGDAAQDCGGDGQATGDGGTQSGGGVAGGVDGGTVDFDFTPAEQERIDRTGRFPWEPDPKPAPGVRHIPGTWLAGLPDGSVVRWVTNEKVLLDHAVRLQGALDEIKRIVGDDILGDERVDAIDTALDRWGV